MSGPSKNRRGRTLNPRIRAINEEIHDLYPYYWHTTDYMQHCIIGPVVLNVYDSEVLEAGVYSMKPRIDPWPAPGYIVKDDQQLFHPRHNILMQLQTTDQAPSSLRLSDIQRKTFKSSSRTQKDWTNWTARAVPAHSAASLSGFHIPRTLVSLPGHVFTNAKGAPGGFAPKACSVLQNGRLLLKSPLLHKGSVLQNS